jgi:hypothetical protein
MATVEEVQAQLAQANTHIAQLNTEIAKQRDIAQNMGAEVTNLTKKFQGIDPDEYSAMKGAIAEFQKEKGGKKDDGAVAAREAELRKDFATQLQERDDKIKGLSGTLKERTVVDGVFTKVAGKIYDKASEEFKDYIRRNCDLTDDGSIVVKNDKGVRYSPKNAAVPMSVDELIEELTTVKDHWFSNPTPAGGHQNGQKFVNGATTITVESLKAIADPTERMKVINSLEGPKRLELLNKLQGASGI